MKDPRWSTVELLLQWDSSLEPTWKMPHCWSKSVWISSQQAFIGYCINTEHGLVHVIASISGMEWCGYLIMRMSRMNSPSWNCRIWVSKGFITSLRSGKKKCFGVNLEFKILVVTITRLEFVKREAKFKNNKKSNFWQHMNCEGDEWRRLEN